jgi:hypothetical protein
MNHPLTLSTASEIGCLLIETSKAEEALALLADPFAKNSKSVGQEHPISLLLFGDIVECYEKLPHLEEAEKLERDILAIQELPIGPDNPDTIQTVIYLSTTLTAQEPYDEAENLALRAVETYKRTFVTTPQNSRILFRVCCHSG